MNIIESIKSALNANKDEMKAIKSNRAQNAKERAKALVAVRAENEVLEYDLIEAERDIHRNSIIKKKEERLALSTRTSDKAAADYAKAEKLNEKATNLVKDLASVLDEIAKLKTISFGGTTYGIAETLNFYAEDERVKRLLPRSTNVNFSKEKPATVGWSSDYTLKDALATTSKHQLELDEAVKNLESMVDELMRN